MTPERWQQVKDIFDSAVERSPASRIAFIRDACGSDDELRKEVESLLASDTETGSLLQNPLIGQDTEPSSPAGPSPLLADDDSYGPYVPVRVLGEGGMGTVYLARQQKPIRREVALKVVKVGMDSRQVLERFEIERQSLALMDYPNVARVLDAGTSQRGRPYFVMEYVDGVPVTQYCDRHSLSTRERLQLFIPVCNALQHAHKKGIIHRDVKPSNVLVTEVDGKPVPKVIDFGIARATDQRSAEGEAFTLAGQIIGTPEYMSPEQASLDNRDIDTGTDVYSLGVVLYELLVGALPLDMKALRKMAFGEVLRAIRETPVPKPTARITQMGAAADAMARHRSTDPGQLRRDLSGDLDSIVMKAIDKDRHCRYGSASEFAADIERYLKNEPVLAGPPGAAYRMRKFVVRHKGPVAAATAVVFALLAGIIATTWEAHVAGQQKTAAISEKAEADKQRVRAEQQAIEAEKQRVRAEQQATEAAKQRDAAEIASGRATNAERTATTQRDRAVNAEGRAQHERDFALTEKQRAETEAATAKAVNDFLQNDLLQQASPLVQALTDTKPEPDVKVRTVLDRAASRIAGKFDTRPLVEASIRSTIGYTYGSVEQYQEAQRQFERVLELRRRVLGEENPGTLDAMDFLGLMYLRQGKFAQAESLLTKALEEHPNTVHTLNSLGGLYLDQGKYAQAEPLFIKALEMSRRVREEHPDTIYAIGYLGLLYFKQGKYAQAEPLFIKALEMSRRVYGEEHPFTRQGMAALGMLYSRQGKDARAEPIILQTLQTWRGLMGEETAIVEGYVNALATIYANQGKYGQAETLYAERLDRLRRALGEEHVAVLVAMNTLGALYQWQSKYAQAEPLFAKIMDIRRRVLGKEHTDTLNAMFSLGSLYWVEGKYSDAEPLISLVLEVRRRVLGEEHTDTLNAASSLGLLFLIQGKYAEAEPLVTRLLEVQRRVLGEEHVGTLTTMNNLAVLYRDEGKYSQAEPLFIKVLETQRHSLGPQHPGTIFAMAALGGLWLREQKYTDAEPLLREALSGYEKLPDGWERYRVQSLLGWSLTGRRQYGEAEPLLLSGYQGLIQREGNIPIANRSEIGEAGERILQLYRDWGKPEKAIEWRAKLDARKATVADKQ